MVDHHITTEVLPRHQEDPRQLKVIPRQRLARLNHADHHRHFPTTKRARRKIVAPTTVDMDHTMDQVLAEVVVVAAGEEAGEVEVVATSIPTLWAEDRSAA